MTRTKLPTLLRRNKFPVRKRPERITKRGPQRFFTEEKLLQVELLSKLSATDKQIALFFNVGQDSVEYWMKNYPEFNEARKKGAIEADMKVAQSLFKRAVGFTYIEKEYKGLEIDGVKIPLSQMALVTKVKKFVPPDVKAIIHWLRIKQTETWSVVPEMLHLHTGKIEHLHKKLQEIPVGELTEEAQRLLFEITQKQLTSANRDN